MIQTPQVHDFPVHVRRKRECAHICQHERAIRVTTKLPRRRVKANPANMSLDAGGEATLATSDVQDRPSQLGRDNVANLTWRIPGSLTLWMRVIVKRDC